MLRDAAAVRRLLREIPPSERSTNAPLGEFLHQLRTSNVQPYAAALPFASVGCMFDRETQEGLTVEEMRSTQLYKNAACAHIRSVLRLGLQDSTTLCHADIEYLCNMLAGSARLGSEDKVVDLQKTLLALLNAHLPGSYSADVPLVAAKVPEDRQDVLFKIVTAAASLTRPLHRGLPLLCVELLENITAHFDSSASSSSADIPVLLATLRMGRVFHVLPEVLHTRLLHSLECQPLSIGALSDSDFRDVVHFVCAQEPPTDLTQQQMRRLQLLCAEELSRRVDASQQLNQPLRTSLHYLLQIPSEDEMEPIAAVLRRGKDMNMLLSEALKQASRIITNTQRHKEISSIQRVMSAYAAKVLTESTPASPVAVSSQDIVSSPVIFKPGRQEVLMAQQLNRWCNRHMFPMASQQLTVQEGYTLDFAWPTARVCIEIDGPFHEPPVPLQLFKSRWLNASTRDEVTKLHFVTLDDLKALWANETPTNDKMNPSARSPFGASTSPNRATQLRNTVLRVNGWKVVPVSAMWLQSSRLVSINTAAFDRYIQSELDETLLPLFKR
jgi:hypothetical protein